MIYKYILFILFTLMISADLSAQKTLWADGIGGKVDVFTKSVVVDKFNNIFLAGFSGSPEVKFSNEISHTNSGNFDSFIAKYSPDGTFLKVENILGGQIYDMVIDSEGNLYIGGTFNADNIHFNNGFALTNYDSGHYHYRDAFIAKYDKDGLCQWARGFKGDYNDYVYAIAVDDFGNIYAGGNFGSQNFYFNDNLKIGKRGNSNAFLTKFDNDGNCQWARCFYGDTGGDDAVSAIGINNLNEIIIAGYFVGNTISIGNNTVLTSDDNWGLDSFIAKLNTTGEAIWANTVYGDKNDIINTLTVDNQDNLYIGGEFNSSALYFDGISLLKGNSATDAFWAKFSNNGNYLKSERIAGKETDRIESMTTDSQNNLYVIGNTFSSTLMFSSNKTLNNTGFFDVFIAKYTFEGICQWVEQIGGEFKEYGTCIVLDSDDNILISGEFDSKTVNFNNGFYLPNYLFNNILKYRDGFIVKYDKKPYSKIIKLVEGEIFSEQKVNVYSIGSLPKYVQKGSANDTEKFDIYLTIYPNPANDYIEISLPNSNHTLQGVVENVQEKVQIFDVLGIEVSSAGGGRSEVDGGGYRIDISHLSAGVYFIKIGEKVEKFVKM